MSACWCSNKSHCIPSVNGHKLQPNERSSELHFLLAILLDRLRVGPSAAFCFLLCEGRVSDVAFFTLVFGAAPSGFRLLLSTRSDSSPSSIFGCSGAGCKVVDAEEDLDFCRFSSGLISGTSFVSFGFDRIFLGLLLVEGPRIVARFEFSQSLTSSRCSSRSSGSFSVSRELPDSFQSTHKNL